MFLELFLFAKNMKFAGFILFPGIPLTLYFMRGHSLVELTEHGNSAADIMVHRYVHICTASYVHTYVP